MIISASRRCDIPSHFGQWFINRLKDGYVLIQNPYNPHRVSKALLTSETIDIIVFWTKNPIPFLKHLPEIDSTGTPYYFEFTLTPYDKSVEKNLPEKQLLIDVFRHLSAKLGKNRMVWRYDPIIIDEIFTIDYHIKNFSDMASQLKNNTTRCVISFVDNYKNVASRMGKNPAYAMSVESMLKISEAFSTIANENDLEIYTCAEKLNLEKYGIKHGSCIDKTLIENILGSRIIDTKDKNQRAECLCLESIDIGTYNCCTNGCGYCYALQNENAAVDNMKRHNPNSPMLLGDLSPDVTVTNRDTKSVVIDQISLFD